GRLLASLQQLHGPPRPHGPVPEQSADDSPLDWTVRRGEAKTRHQIPDDVIVVAGVQDDVVSPCVDDSPHHVDRLIPVEGRNLDRHDIRKLGEAAPESITQRTPAY